MSIKSRFSKKLGLLASILIITSSFSAHADSLNEKVERIIASSGFVLEQTGVAAMSVKDGKTLVDVNGNLKLNPASCTKIITAAASLEALGSDYKFETIFWVDQPIDKTGQIDTLFISGNGDPSLVSEKLWRMVGNLANHGLKKITKEIVIDNSFFDGPSYPRKNGNEDRAYTAHTSAVALNFNTIMIMVMPPLPDSKDPRVLVEPENDYIKVINKVKTGAKFSIGIKNDQKNNHSEEFKITGTIPVNSKPAVFYKKVLNPSLYASAVLKKLLAQNNIDFQGKVRIGKTPSLAQPILLEKSKPLASIVRDMMKFSNNFTAEQLTKHLGAVRKGKPGSTEKGIQVLQEYLTSLGITPDTYDLENGSGLSTKNQLTAWQLVKVLRAVYNDFKVQPDFVASLSILGVDGTMQTWKQAPQLRGDLRAKTGSLANVSTLAGYIPLENGDIVAFAILINGFKKDYYSKHQTQKGELKIVSEIVKSGL
ncbi:MAG: D-alanyl-D-alanine carboxypeptidase/D-alanyl-D-alanine-endopeptidase [Pseudomonadota bacterium]